MMQTNVCGWFEIPVSDMQRAISFYEKVLGLKLHHQDLGNLEMAWFPHDMEHYGSSGALVFNPEFYHPSEKGSILYLSTATGDLNIDAKVIAQNGGKVTIPRRQISPEHGYMLVFKDCEGNRVALHSNT